MFSLIITHKYSKLSTIATLTIKISKENRSAIVCKHPKNKLTRMCLILLAHPRQCNCSFPSTEEGNQHSAAISGK